ncbi:MAG: DUF167 domain-containing protein [bacterium]
MSGRDNSAPLIQEISDGVIIRVRVHPRASKVSVGPVKETSLAVRLTAAPVDNAANRQCIAALARRLGVRAHQVEIVSGHKSREKRVRVEGIDARRARDALGI